MAVIITELSRNLMRKDDPEMTAKDVVEFVQLLNQNHIDVCIDGGWGDDALLGEQTRTHAGLDVAVQHKDVAQISRSIIMAHGLHLSFPEEHTGAPAGGRRTPQKA